MATQLLANTNTIGSGLPLGVTSRDSGQILTAGRSGAPPRRQTFGGQQRASQPIQCDATSVGTANFIPGSNNNPYGAAATITNITIAAAVNNVNTVTFSATNTLVANQIVKLGGLTTAPQLNNIAGLVLSTGLSGSGFQITLIGIFNVAAVGSSVETGTATVDFNSDFACLSMGPENS